MLCIFQIPLRALISMQDAALLQSCLLSSRTCMICSSGSCCTIPAFANLHQVPLLIIMISPVARGAQGQSRKWPLCMDGVISPDRMRFYKAPGQHLLDCCLFIQTPSEGGRGGVITSIDAFPAGIRANCLATSMRLPCLPKPFALGQTVK